MGDTLPRSRIHDTEDLMRVSSPADLGNAVRGLRRDQGWTQAHLAEQAGVSRQWLNAVETGAVNPTWDVVARLLEALGAEIDVRPLSAAPAAFVARGQSSVVVDLDRVLDQHRSPAGQTE